VTPTLASASAVVDVAVIGAGAAGLAAASRLRHAGHSTLILEAGNRIGGRAWTDTPKPLGGAVFDHGAEWLHAAHRNPLVKLAASHGEEVYAETPWDDRVRILGARSARAPMPAYKAAETAWRDAVTARLAGADCSLAEAGSAVAGDIWTATIESWEGAIIAAADADALSLRDWHANALEGENFVVQGGLGAMLGRCLGPAAGLVRFSDRVIRVEAGAGHVRVQTASGASIRAGAAICTVSTGVLRAGHIAFAPCLPGEIIAALAGLPMGLLAKIALPAAGGDRLGLAPGTTLFRRLEHRGAPFLSARFWPQGRDIAVGYVGGRAAWELAGKPDQAAELFRGEIAAMLGTGALSCLAPGALMTAWGTDPAFLGAYAYAIPGAAGARAVLAAPLWDGRLVFAGEACDTDGLAGTVAGAYFSGARAADSVMGGFTRMAASV
jgi:monoamine oxidase